MTEAALSDVVVLEIASGVAGPYAGRLLADLGARVIKVEPPGGDRLRSAWPVVDGESAFFAWLNGGKLGVEARPGDEAVAALAKTADVILHDLRGVAADELEAAFRIANPAAVVLSITPYGRTGPRSDWLATPLTEWATGGYHYFGGEPDREPIWLPGHQAEFHAGVQAAIAALAGLRTARRSGFGQGIEVSHQEAVLCDHAWLTISWTHQGKVQQRAGSAFVRCADGYVFMFNLVPYPNLFVLIERLDLLEDISLQVPANWWARYSEVLGALSAWAATRTKAEIYHAAQELRIAMTPLNTMADVAANPQLAARGVLRTVEVVGREFVAPCVPYQLTETPCLPPRRAPRLGEHNGEPAPSRQSGVTPAARRTQSSTSPEALPLAGVRALEVTANWAGPGAGRHLADLGADVIKIELATKPASRALAPVADDLWPEHYHRAGYFNKLNRNKRAICLDLSKDAGREVFFELVRRSDIVLENNAARVMSNLGVDYSALRGINPALIMCSMSGFGATGPERNYSAYGSNIESASGLASLMGYGPGEFEGTGSYYADPLTANHGAVAMLAALHARERTGTGQWIEMSLLEAALPFFAQHFLQHTVTGEVPVPSGNEAPDMAPHGVYRTYGRDCWLAVAVRDERDWLALCGVIGAGDLAVDPALRTLAGRRKRAGDIDSAISSWAAVRDHIAAAGELQAAGVPAAPVMPNWEIFSDNHLNDRDFFARVRHEKAGTLHYPGFAFRFEATPLSVRLPAPMFAEHNDAVFRDLLGLGDAAVQALYDADVTSDLPRFGAGTSL